jgi:hypothetical protein
MASAPNFTALVAAAYPDSGDAQGESLDALWNALFDLPEWYMLVHPSRIERGDEPYPFVANVEGEGWAMVFTSARTAQQFAADQDLVGSDGKAFVMSMETATMRRWISALAEHNVRQVRFDEGPHGWFAPIAQVEAIAAHLGRPLA